MNITKIGHCCLVIKIVRGDKTLTLLTDPGSYTTGQVNVREVDAILITHEHPDHLHMDSLKQVLANNPDAVVVTNQSVGKLLEKENIPFTKVAHGESIILKDVHIIGAGEKHAEIYKEIPLVENTGYFIDNKLFYPGDTLYDPERPVDILALPVAGPWIKTSEAIEYGLSIMPRKAFPVHDGMLNDFGAPFIRQPQKFLTEAGIEFVALELNKEIEL